MTFKKTPIDPIDVHVGKRIKLRRTLLHISQEYMGGQIGVAFQQVQKYENGHNRVSSSMLYRIAKVLGTDVQFFFEGLAPTDTKAQGASDPMRSEVGMRLVRLVTRRLSPVATDHLLALLETVSPHPRLEAADYVAAAE